MPVPGWAKTIVSSVSQLKDPTVFTSASGKGAPPLTTDTLIMVGIFEASAECYLVLRNGLADLGHGNLRNSQYKSHHSLANLGRFFEISQSLANN